MDGTIQALHESPDTLSEARTLMTEIARTVPVSSISPLDRALVLVAAVDRVGVDDLARLLGVRRCRAGELVAELIRLGYAERHSTVDSKDRRRRSAWIQSTTEGRATAVDTQSELRVSAVSVALVIGRLRTVGDRVLLRLLDGAATYHQLREATSSGERVVREAARALRARVLIDRDVTRDSTDAIFRFRLSAAGRAAAERMVGQVDLALRDLAIAPSLGSRLANASAPSAIAAGSAP